ISINSQYAFSLLGLKSNGSEQVTLTDNVEWSLSAGAESTITQQGIFSAGANAEYVTLNTNFGVYNESIDIKVSAAKFDQVVKLDEQTLSIDMCQSSDIQPIGRYVDDDGEIETRPVDSTIIDTITWIIRNSEDDSESKRAHIATVDNQASLHTLSSGGVNIQAQAFSANSGSVVTSEVFDQEIGSELSAIKLCRNSTDNWSGCTLTSTSLEQGKVLSVIALGTYQDQDGVDFYENITRNSIWATTTTANASIIFSSGLGQIDVTGESENTSANILVACGGIEQSLDGIDIAGGVVLNSLVSCDSSLNCESTSATINVTERTVSSFTVTANGIDVEDDESSSLSERPDEIGLDIVVNFNSGDSLNITEDGSTVYSIIDISGQDDVIAKISGSPGIFTVLTAGTAKIQFSYRDEYFVVILEVP
ncbi:MAG: hypothetical protein GY784_05850, partial [Gammaproteobacteria bacterium]|nr:hypothetical protein [Gammaproteobacteria bacterium]